MPNADSHRIERDSLGEKPVPAVALYGIHTVRAVENFPLAGRRCDPELIHAYGDVKTAALTAAEQLGDGSNSPAVIAALIRAAREVADGQLDDSIIVDALQGGAGTSLNMNVNEVIANRALQLLDKPLGDYDTVSPLDDVNRYQSTNDTYPTALKLAAIRRIRRLEAQLVRLQESFQSKEKEFAHIVKVGRTEMQDAVLTTLGREMGAYAEAINRDRWRVYKCEERLRVVNLGGTAIGTGLAAPRQYIFRVVDILRDQTGIGFARAENLFEATQNADVFVEVSGILKANAATLWKIASDLRFLSSGPQAGIGEIRLPARQAGSSIMPGKVNPVIPEAVTQAAMAVIANDVAVSTAAASGNLELNPFFPLIADRLLDSIALLTTSCELLASFCVDDIQANETICRKNALASTACVTALLPLIGYDAAAALAKRVAETGRSVKEIAVGDGLISEADFDAQVTPEAVCRLGSPPMKRKEKTSND